MAATEEFPDGHRLKPLEQGFYLGRAWSITNGFKFLPPPATAPNSSEQNVGTFLGIAGSAANMVSTTFRNISVSASQRGRVGEEPPTTSSSTTTALPPSEVIHGHVTGYQQEIQVMAYPGRGRVFNSCRVGQVVVSGPEAVAWLRSMRDRKPRHWSWRAGLDLERLPCDYDIFIYLPYDMQRDEQHLDSALYLAFVSMATGWTMDPEVRSLRHRLPA